MLYSNLKPEGYLVTGPEIHLHYVIKNGQTVGLTQLPDKKDLVSDSPGEILSEVKMFYTSVNKLHFKKYCPFRLIRLLLSGR